MPSARFALVAVIAGCYSPSYDDCQVACVNGACPSGLVCDEALHACRPPSASGACGSSIDAPMPDTLDGDGAAKTYCSDYPTAAFCADFDAVAQPEQGWSATSLQGGGSFALVSSTRSGPNAFQASTPADASGAIERTAMLFRTFAAPAAFSEIHFAFDYRATVRDGATADKLVAIVGANSTTFHFDMASSGPNQNDFYVVDGTAKMFDTVVLGTWIRYEMTVKQLNNTVKTTVTHDGVGVGSTSGDVGNPTPWPGQMQEWQIGIGAMNVSANGICTFEFDNVLVTVN